MNKVKKMSLSCALIVLFMITLFANLRTDDVQASSWFENRIQESNNKDLSLVSVKMKSATSNEGYLKIDGATKKLSRIMTAISMGVATITIVFAGYEYMVADGKPEKVYGAKMKIIYTFVGLSIIMLASTLLEIVATIVGF